MIPLPPPDLRLPGLGAALDGDAMAPALEKALGEMTVHGCSPYYVKYKPHRYARVQYDLDVVDPHGERARVPAHVAIYPPAKAEKVAARHCPADRAAANPQPVYLRQLNGIAQLFPVDLSLPGLARAAAPDVMVRLFSHDLRDVLDGQPQECEIELVRYKAGKRAVLKYHLGGTPVRAVYGKLRKDRAQSLVETGAALRRAGVATPATLAWLPDIGMAIQAEAPGARLAGLRHTEEYTAWMPAVAETLAGLHNARVAGLPRWSPRAECEELHEAAEMVAALLPHVGPFATSVARRIAAILTTIDGRLTPTHGSFHDDQILVGELGVNLIDTDSAMLGNPQSDLGHFLSYLSAEHADDSYELFLDRYLSTRPSGRGEYRIFEAASLLRWATIPFRELRSDWPEAVEARVRRAADILPRQ